MDYLFEVMSFVIPVIFWIIFISVMVNIGKARSNSKNSAPRYTIPSKTTAKAGEGSHQQQVDYSHAYSVKNTTRDSEIHDAPLTEAEKNVLYGK